MQKLLSINSKTAIILYVLIDIICVGIGMGVPFLPIMLGLPLGWYITRRISKSEENVHLVYKNILKFTILAAIFTFLQMLIIWGPKVGMLFDASSDIEHWGHPFILYDAKVSFIGWLVLMIFISPFLQVLTTIFASFITLQQDEA